MIARIAPPLSWLAAGAVSTLALADVGHHLGSVLLISAYWSWCIVLPGALLHRCLFPGQHDRIMELARGAVLGLCFELPARAIAVYLGMAQLSWLWPLLVVALAFGIPAARARVRCRPAPTHVGAAVATAFVAAAGVVMLWSTYLRAQPVPNGGSSTYPDLMFHLGITRNLQIEAWPSDPQVAGTTLVYHWFANSHIAGLSSATGVDAAEMLFHLWLVPMLLLMAALLTAVARQCAGAWWAGPLLGWLTLVGTSMLLIDPRLWIVAANAFTPLSPSQVFATPVFVALSSLFIDFLRGQRDYEVWGAALVLALVAAGSKPTVLPMLAAGLAMALAFAWFRTGRLDKGLLSLVVMTAVVVMATQGALVGSSGGSSLGLLALLRGLKLYDELTGDTSPPGSGGLLPDAVATGSGVAVVVSLSVAFLLMQTPHLLGLLALARPGLRSDAAVPFLAGTGAAAWAGLLLLDHPGQSQYYFLYTGLPVLTLLSIWLIADSRTETARNWVPVAAVGVVGGLTVLALRESIPVPSGLVWAVVAVSVLAVGIAAVLTDRFLPVRRWEVSGSGRGFTAPALVALLAMTLPLWLSSVVNDHRSVAVGAGLGSERPLSSAAVEAGRWVDAHAAEDDLVVTNVHCRLLSQNACDPRGFWVAGLTGRRVLLGGWAYTSEGMETAHDAGGDPKDESPWPGRLRASNRAVAAPTETLLNRLADRGVRWIVADRRHSRVSPRLARLAEQRFDGGKVTVYELRPRD